MSGLDNTKAASDKDKGFSYTRRGFFGQLAREAKVTIGMFQGTPSFRLADLPDMPPDEIGSLCPMVNPLYEVQAIGYDVIARNTDSGAEMRLFGAADDLAMVIFNRFDGQHTLAKVAGRVSVQMDIEPAEAWGYVRRLFLELVAKRVVVPRNPPGLLG